MESLTVKTVQTILVLHALLVMISSMLPALTMPLVLCNATSQTVPTVHLQMSAKLVKLTLLSIILLVLAIVESEAASPATPQQMSVVNVPPIIS